MAFRSCVLALLIMLLGNPAPCSDLDLIKAIPEKANLPPQNAIDFGTVRISNVLLEGWEPNSKWERVVSVNWVSNTRASIRLPRCKISDKLLYLRVMPYYKKNSPEQWCKLKLNGLPLGKIRLEKNWWSYEIRVPAKMLNPDKNILEFNFSHVEPYETLIKSLWVANTKNVSPASQNVSLEPDKPEYRAAIFDYLIFYDDDTRIAEQPDVVYNKFVVTAMGNFGNTAYNTVFCYPQGAISFNLEIKPGDHVIFTPITWKLSSKRKDHETVMFQVSVVDQNKTKYIIFNKEINEDNPANLVRTTLDLDQFSNQKVTLIFETAITGMYGLENLLGLWGDPVLESKGAPEGNN